MREGKKPSKAKWGGGDGVVSSLTICAQSNGTGRRIGGRETRGETGGEMGWGRGEMKRFLLLVLTIKSCSRKAPSRERRGGGIETCGKKKGAKREEGGGIDALRESGGAKRGRDGH